MAKKLKELSYRKIGEAIVKFTNNFSEDGELVSLIEPLGLKGE